MRKCWHAASLTSWKVLEAVTDPRTPLIGDGGRWVGLGLVDDHLIRGHGDSFYRKSEFTVVSKSSLVPVIYKLFSITQHFKCSHWPTIFHKVIMYDMPCLTCLFPFRLTQSVHEWMKYHICTLNIISHNFLIPILCQVYFIKVGGKVRYGKSGNSTFLTGFRPF